MHGFSVQAVAFFQGQYALRDVPNLVAPASLSSWLLFYFIERQDHKKNSNIMLRQYVSPKPWECGFRCAPGQDPAAG
jgi:hypothetical protein